MTSRNCIGKNLNKPFPSLRTHKLKQICVRDKKGKIINIHYGDKRFKQNYSKQARKSFRARHKCDPVSKLDKTTARYYACQDLW